MIKNILLILLFCNLTISQIIIDPSSSPNCQIEYIFEKGCGSPRQITIQSPNYSNRVCRIRIVVPEDSSAQFNCSNLSGVYLPSNDGVSSSNFQITHSRNDYFIHFSPGNPLRFQCSVSLITPNSGASQRKSCGNPNRNINIPNNGVINGKLPWTVLLYNIDDPGHVNAAGSIQFCMGTIISPNWILTSAECVYWRNLYRMEIFATFNSVADESDRSIKVDRIIMHPNFRLGQNNNEIALLHVANPIPFSNMQSAICLPWHLMNTTSDVNSGILYSSGPNQIRTWALISNSECERRQWPVTNQSIRPDLICSDDTRRGPCERIHGASLDFQDGNGKFYAYGLTWYSLQCDQVDGTTAHTRVSEYLEWILQTAGDSVCVE